MNIFLSDSRRSAMSCLFAALFITACGGGGSGTGNSPATISGTTIGTVSASVGQATGTLTVVDLDAGQATFLQPSSLTGTYGTWSVSITGSTATWRYTLDAARTPSVTSTESLSIRSQDGSATQQVVVTISVGSGSNGSGSTLVTSVADPVYTGSYADEKVAVFNRLNEDRARCGFGKLAQNSKLDLAAQNHANYLQSNKTLSHDQVMGNPGYTGKTLANRLDYVGYPFSISGEVIGQTYWGTWYDSDYPKIEPSATNQLYVLYSSIYHFSGLMFKATEVGIGVSTFQWNADGTSNAKSAVVDMAVPAGNSTGQLIAVDGIATFPCQGVSNLIPAFRAETPDPFPSVDRSRTPYGQPVYIASGLGTNLVLLSGSITKRGGASVSTVTLTKSNDPNGKVLSNEAFLVPTERLADNTVYDVTLTGTSTGMFSSTNPTGAFVRNFSFTTGTILSQ